MQMCIKIMVTSCSDTACCQETQCLQCSQQLMCYFKEVIRISKHSNSHQYRSLDMGCSNEPLPECFTRSLVH